LAGQTVWDFLICAGLAPQLETQTCRNNLNLIAHLVGEGNYLYPYPMPTDRQLELENRIGQIQQWLQTYCQEATQQGVSTEFAYGVEEATSAICDLARSWGADLVVVGRRGRQGLTEALLGSVSNYVLHHAPCSVLVIQGLVFKNRLVGNAISNPS